MKKNVLVMMVAVMCLLGACGKKEPEVEPSLEESQIEVTEEEPEETTEEIEETVEEPEVDESIITERTIIDGKMQSYLTGEWKNEEIANRRSMAVMIPNNKGTFPHYGISMASIVYEAPVEGRVTRLMMFFEDYDDLKRIGPVRSSRDYYVYEAMAYDSIYVNWGLAVPFVKDLINSDRVDNVSQAVTGIDKPASEAFDRISRPGYKKEYTGYLFIDGYEKAVERLGYETEYRDQFVQAFTFANDGHRSEYTDHKDATMIYPGGTSTNNGGYGNAKPYFEYREEDGLYYRYQYGDAYKDEMNGEHLSFSNVIFKVCHGEVREPKGNDYLAFGVHGEGKAYIFTNGKVIEGTWVRSGDYEPNLFLDEEGNEIIFNQGKTWICNIWKEYEEYAVWE